MKSLVAALTFLALLGVSSAYYCYVCQSDEFYDGASCADPFFKGDSTLHKRLCSGDCFKEVTTNTDNQLQSYRRGCDACTDGCTTQNNIRVCRYCCFGQLCNSADGLHFNRMVAIVTSVAATLYYFL